MSKIILKFLLLINTVFVSLININCNSCITETGEVNLQKFTFEEFSAVELNIDCKVYLHQANENYLSIQTNDSLFQFIETTNKRGRFKIEADNCIKENSFLEVHIYSKVFDEISVKGATEVFTAQGLKGENLDLNIEGSGKVELQLDFKKIDTEITASGDVYLSGSVDTHEIFINDSGNLTAFSLLSKKTNAKIKHSGNCKIYVSNELIAQVNGSGDLQYKGTPKNVETEITDSGRAKQVP